MIKFAGVQKKPIGTWPFGQIGVWFNPIIQNLKFCKIPWLFFLSVSPVSGESERIERKFKTEKPSQSVWLGGLCVLMGLLVQFKSPLSILILAAVASRASVCYTMVTV